MDEFVELSPSLEDYLEAIYNLEQMEGSAVRLTDVAQHLSVSKASVNRAIGTLKQSGLVLHEHYGTLSLTPSGQMQAKDIYRRHLVLKAFLIDVLDVDPALAEKEACLMEHALSSSTVEKWIVFLEKLTGRRHPAASSPVNS
jgi:Mn-dependent DtxR family transcriptional regulator